MAKRKKAYKYIDVMWRLKQGYYCNRWGLHAAEAECLQAAINGFMITNYNELMILKNFGFDVSKNLSKIAD